MTRTLIFSHMLFLGGLSLAAEDARSIPVGQRQLFLDDHAIEKIENLKRTLHQPQKRGAVIRSANPAQTIQTRTAPVWDPEAKLFKLWVMSTDQPLRVSSDSGRPPTAGMMGACRLGGDTQAENSSSRQRLSDAASHRRYRPA